MNQAVAGWDETKPVCQDAGNFLYKISCRAPTLALTMLRNYCRLFLKPHNVSGIPLKKLSS